MQQWLRRPVLSITLSPGKREGGYEEAKSVAAATPPKPKIDSTIPKPTRTIPPLGPLQPLTWPAIEHAKLSNGIEVVYAHRNAVPLTQLALSFDAGGAADPVTQRGLGAMTLGLLEQGTTSLSAQQVAEAEERLGAEISASNDYDRSAVTLSALSPNLEPSLHLLGDIIEHPVFAPADVDRVRAQSLAGLAQLMKDPQRVGNRVLPAAIFGAAHPYGAPAGGDPAAIAKFNHDDLVGFQQRWLRPDNAKIFVVSDRPLSEIQPLLEREFGTWSPPAVAKGVKTIPALRRARRARESCWSTAPERRSRRSLAGSCCRSIRTATFRRSTSPTKRSAGNSCRGSTWTCAKPRAGRTASAGSQSFLPNDACLHHLGPGPGRPHRRTRSPRSAPTIADFLGAKGMTPDELTWR